MIALTSDTLSKGQMYDAASTIMAQKLAQVQGVGQVGVGGSALPGVRIELNPTALNKYGIGLEQVRSALAAANANTPKGHFSDGQQMWEVGANDQLFNAIDYKPLLIAYHNGAAGARLRRGRRGRFGGGPAQRRVRQRQAFRAGHHLPPAGRQHHRHRGPHPRRAAADSRRHSGGHRFAGRHGSDPDHPRFGPRRGADAAASRWGWWSWWSSCS